jgi:hypothetical protein
MTQKREHIFDLLQHKSGLKQAIYRNTLDRFHELKSILENIENDLAPRIAAVNQSVEVKYNERSLFEAELKFSGDMLSFNMHTNVFSFDHKHFVHQTPYVQADPNRAFCGKIDIYNFLADSYKYNRLNDIGHLIGRIFINHENHFFVEGKKQLGFLYSDFSGQSLGKDQLCDIVETAMLHALEFDLMVPPFEAVQEISLAQKLFENGNAGITTGKRLGFSNGK